MTKKKRLIWSAVISIGLLVLSYWVCNLPLSLTGEAVLLKELNTIHIRDAKNEIADSVRFINVSYDRVMVPLISSGITDNGDTIPIPQGRIPITDRHKLLKLLQYLKEKDDYAYILLDVFFGDEKTEFDDELFSTIMSMSRIAIPYREDEMLADESLKHKAFLSKYSFSIWETGFTKYQYYRKTKKGNTERTLPAAMFEDYTGRRIKKIGPIYWEDGHFAKRSNFLSIDVLPPDKWYNLGMDLFDDTLGVFVGDEMLYDSPNLTKGKYIVIGRIDNDDMHETIRGELPGSVIVFNAFYSMKNGQYQIEWWFIMLLFAIYFSMTYCLVFSNGGKEVIVKSSWYKNLKMGWRIVIFLLLSWLGYASVLGMLSLIMYLWLGKVFEFFIVSNVFSAMSLIVKFNKQG